MNIWSKIGSFCDFKGLVWLLIIFGIALRLTNYLSNRSLWIDEAALSVNIVNRTYTTLLQPLDHKQVAPIGFLFAEKFMVHTFGNSEYTLRFIPFLAGVVSIFIFLKVARITLEGRAALIALTLFVTAWDLIWRSSEVKQYSTEVATGLILLWFTFYLMSHKYTVFRLGAFGLLGGAAVWFSHAAVFFLAGIGLCMTGIHLSRKEWGKTGFLAVVFLFWLVNFAIIYKLFLTNVNIARQHATPYWHDGYMPLPPTSFADMYWFFETFRTVFQNPGKFTTSNITLAMICFLVGYYFIFRNRRGYGCLLVFPVLLALLASGLRVYSFIDRLVLFALPTLFLGVGEGVEQIRKRLWLSTPIISTCFVVLVLFVPVTRAGKMLIKPFSKYEIKLVLQYIRDHKQPEDTIYLHRSGKAFNYYAERYGLSDMRLVESIRDENRMLDYHASLEQMRGQKRAWILLYGADDENFFLNYLDNMGTRLDSYKIDRVSLYLYDLSTKGKSISGFPW